MEQPHVLRLWMDIITTLNALEGNFFLLLQKVYWTLPHKKRHQKKPPTISHVMFKSHNEAFEHNVTLSFEVDGNSVPHTTQSVTSC